MPHSRIIILRDFNAHKFDYLTYSPDIFNPGGHDAEAFAIVNDQTQAISDPTRIPDGARDKTNTLFSFSDIKS